MDAQHREARPVAFAEIAAGTGHDHADDAQVLARFVDRDGHEALHTPRTERFRIKGSRPELTGTHEIGNLARCRVMRAYMVRHGRIIALVLQVAVPGRTAW